MTTETTVFGKSSYEYAIGCFKASTLQPLTPEQFSRLNDADMDTALKLLSEYGYPSAENSGDVTEAIEKGMAEVTAFIRKNSPDGFLTDLLFFEEDALNLKIYLKAARSGISADSFAMTDGGIDREVLRVCAETEDFSLIGDSTDKALSGIGDITDPSVISCMIDSAMFARSLSEAKKSGKAKAFVKLLNVYGKSRNRLTALRLTRLGRDITECAYAFLPAGDDISAYKADTAKKPETILAEAASSLDTVINELSYDESMGFIARFYFIKKNEAARLRLMFAEKNLTTGGTADE